MISSLEVSMLTLMCSVFCLYFAEAGTAPPREELYDGQLLLFRGDAYLVTAATF